MPKIGLHALIIGISAYPKLPGDKEPLRPHHYGMRKLYSPAISAFKTHQWLQAHQDNLSVPLASCTLLVVPSDEELQCQPELRNYAAPCTLSHLQEEVHKWREQAKSHSSNVTFFYFAGHGVQRESPSDHVLLLSGFGKEFSPALGDSLVTSNLHEGMAPSLSQNDIARTQLFFIDACRTANQHFTKKQYLNAGSLWDVDPSSHKYRDNRVAPIFFTTEPGAEAFGLKCNQTFFNEALLQCLDGGAGVKIGVDDQGNDCWGVTISSLHQKLQTVLNQVTNAHSVEQIFKAYGIGGDTSILTQFKTPPLVEVSLHINPEPARSCTSVKVEDAQDNAEWDLSAPIRSHPYCDKLRAGIYQISAAINPGLPFQITRRKFLKTAEPPYAPWHITVQAKA
jgi:hypothetical protein